jgi:broad-specificity NMP kinase
MPGNEVDILLLRGAPGVGKSTTARKLRHMLPTGAIIEVDTLRGMIAAVKWVDTQQHLLALEHAHLLAESFLRRGFSPVLIIDTFSRGKLLGFIEKLSRPYLIATLHARWEVLRSRVEQRPDEHFKDLAAIQLLHDEVARNRYPHELLIDTSELSPADTAAELAKWLQDQGKT